VATYEDAEQPGIYQFFLGDQLLTAFAVNVDLSESDLDPIGADQAGELLGKEMVFSVAPDADLETAILQSRHGRELWKAVLWGVLALMAVEMVLGKSGSTTEKKTLSRDHHRRS
jgi:hypothetical protein